MGVDLCAAKLSERHGVDDFQDGFPYLSAAGRVGHDHRAGLPFTVESRVALKSACDSPGKPTMISVDIEYTLKFLSIFSVMSR